MRAIPNQIKVRIRVLLLPEKNQGEARALQGRDTVSVARFHRRAHGPPLSPVRSCEHREHPDTPMQRQTPWAPRRRLAKQRFLDYFRLNPVSVLLFRRALSPHN